MLSQLTMECNSDFNEIERQLYIPSLHVNLMHVHNQPLFILCFFDKLLETEWDHYVTIHLNPSVNDKSSPSRIKFSTDVS